MKSNIPWSVKGIDPEAREAAKIAARKAGMTLGEWLNSLILQSGELPEGLAQQIGSLLEEEEAGEEDDESLTEDEDPNDELQARIENLTRKLDQADRQAAVSGIDESIERLANTIEGSRRMLPSGDNAQKIINDLTQRLERISARVEEVAGHRSGIDPKTLVALERAIAGVASHIEKSDRRNTELVQSVEDALSQLGTRVDGAESVAISSVGRIDVSLDRLASRIDNAESEARRSSARLSERLGQIDERLSHAAIEREATLSTVERRLAGFDAKLQTVQARLETAAAQAARSNVPPDAVTRVELEEASRRQASDLNAESATIKRTVTAIESRLSTLLDRIDRLRIDTDNQLREIDRKSDEALKQAQAKPEADAQTTTAIDEIQQSLAAFGDKFDRTNHTATETMSALEGVLRSLTRRLDTLEGRPPRASEVPPPTPAAQPPAPAAAAPSTSDLPKRPTWSWGVGRQVQQEPGSSAEEPEAEQAQPEPQRPQRSAAEEDLRSRFRLGKRDIVEVINEESEDEDIEEQVAEQADTETYAAEEETIAEYTEQQHAAPEGEAEIDLSNLQFNLDGSREESEGESGWSGERWQNLPVRSEPKIDTEVESTPGLPVTGTYLEQARRAAQAAGPGERISDFGIEDDEPNRKRMYMIIGGVVVVFIIVIVVGFLLRPLLLKHSTPTATATESPATAGTAKPGAAQSSASSEPPASTATAQPPAEPGAPSENAIGPQLPEEKTPANTSSAAPSSSAQTAPTPPPATPLDALKAAAQAGNARALFALALDYKSGRDGVEANSVQALNSMRQAADKNLAVAQHTLGVWYEQGDGVDKDIAKAREWYEKAANNGDYQAMHNLGYFAAQGLGGLTADKTLAVKWFKSAADRGLVASQVNLAIVYSQMGQNDQAYLYSKVAADRDPSDKDAPRMRDTFGPMLPPDVKAKMDDAAKKWKPTPIDVVANGGFDTSPEAFQTNAPPAQLSKDELKSVQELLNDQGFKAGTADGHPGGQTETAIKAFQAKYGLPQTGIANKDLLAALESVPR
ncbi:MAG: peptidoglycan-binding protein [Alphaproteobacteria bacterium]